MIQRQEKKSQGKSMTAKLISVEGTKVKIEITIELSESMLDSEKKIQEGLNEAGCIATKEALRKQDTDGTPITIGDKIWRTKGEKQKPIKQHMEKY